MLASRRQLIGLALAFAAILLVAPFLLPEYRLVTAANAGLYALFALGLCAIFSYCGQFSLAQGVFGTVAGFLMGSLAMEASVPLWAGALIGMAGSAVVAAATGVLLFRLRGFYFAIATLLLSAMATTLVTNQLRPWTGGEFGLSLEPGAFAGLSLTDVNEFYYLVWGCVAIVAVGFANLERSRVVRAARAVKSSERAAEVAGIAPTRVKLGMFVLSAVLAGLAGVLLVGSAQYATPETFDVSLSVLIFVGVVIGGRSNLWGALLGGIFLIVIGDVLNPFGEGATLVYGLLYVGVLLFLPGGLASLPDLVDRLRGKGVTGPTITLSADAGAPAPVAEPKPIAERGQPVLDVEGLRVAFGAFESVRGVSFSVPAGSILALLGPNGAGKTSVLNAISGLVRPAAGTIRFEGKDITTAPIHVRRRLGVARTLQNPHMVQELSIWENIALGCDFEFRHGTLASSVSWPSARRAEHAIRDRSRALAAEVGLGEAADWRGGALSFGQQRLIELARAMAGRSSLLLLDEPFAGLSPEMIDQVKRLLLRLVARGYSIVIIDHNLEHVDEIADSGLVLVEGQVARRGKVADLAREASGVTSVVSG